MRLSFVAIALSFSAATTADSPKARVVELGRRDGTHLLVRIPYADDSAAVRYAKNERSLGSMPYPDVLSSAVGTLHPRGPTLVIPRQAAASTQACASRTSAAPSTTPTPSDKPKGNCPDDKIQDPADGRSQPDCISDDDKKCPEGQKAESRKKGRTIDEAAYEPQCAPDPDPDFKCDKEGTYDHKEIVDGQIKHSCRSTRAKTEQKTSKYATTVDDNKKKSDANVDKKKDEERDRKRRARNGACLAIMLTAEAWDTAETSALTEDEVDGLVNSWDETLPDPGFDIQDRMVTVREPVTLCGGIQMETAGIPLIGSLSGIASSLSKVASGLGKTMGKTITGIKAGSRIASTAAKDAAKNSKTVQKILKDDAFLDCVMFGAATAAGAKFKREERKREFQLASNKHVIIDQDADHGDQGGSPDDLAERAVGLGISKDEDGDMCLQWQTYADNYSRNMRVQFEKCQALGDSSNVASRVEVQGGCCAFYNNDDCTDHLFSMTNREDANLKGKDNDSISSMWCTFDVNCAGAPST